MDTTHDGGPAFPRTYVSDGMSLRDYFASEASRGAADALCDMLEPIDPMETFDPVQRLAEVKRHAEQHAMVAYIYADAMLRARAQPAELSPAERQAMKGE